MDTVDQKSGKLITAGEKECLSRLKKWAANKPPCVSFLINALKTLDNSCDSCANLNTSGEDSDDFEANEDYLERHILRNKLAGDYATLCVDIKIALKIIKKLNKKLKEFRV